MSSTCSSWRRRSPAMARASSGSKSAMESVIRNMRAWAFRCAENLGRELYRNDPRAAAAVAASEQVGDHRGPGLADVDAVVTPATQRQHPPVAEFIRQGSQVAGGAAVSPR